MTERYELIPFAIVTIFIYAVTAAFVVMKVWGVRESDHVLFQMLVLGDWIPELTGALAVLMTILLLGPLNLILDKLWKKPAEPMMLIVEPEGTNVKVRLGSGSGRAQNPKDNTIYYQRKWYRVGENTIENIYPAKNRHPWMDHPENKASGITSVQRLTDILKGYEASLEAARREQEWLEKHGGQTE